MAVRREMYAVDHMQHGLAVGLWISWWTWLGTLPLQSTSNATDSASATSTRRSKQVGTGGATECSAGLYAVWMVCNMHTLLGLVNGSVEWRIAAQHSSIAVHEVRKQKDDIGCLLVCSSAVVLLVQSILL